MCYSSLSSSIVYFSFRGLHLYSRQAGATAILLSFSTAGDLVLPLLGTWLSLPLDTKLREGRDRAFIPYFLSSQHNVGNQQICTELQSLIASAFSIYTRHYLIFPKINGASQFPCLTCHPGNVHVSYLSLPFKPPSWKRLNIESSSLIFLQRQPRAKTQHTVLFS